MMGCGSSKVDDSQTPRKPPSKPVEVKSLKDIGDLANDRSLARIRNEIAALNEGEVYLSFTGKNIGDKEVRLIAALLMKKGQGLESLYLNENNIGPEGAAYISELLKDHPTITELDLEQNCLGADGVAYIGEMLAKNKTLLKLDLTNNKIGDWGAQSLGQGLITNSSLEKLEVDDNGISDAGVEGLMKFHENDTSQLTIMVLSSNAIGPRGTKAIAKGLATNPQLRDLYLSNNKIDDEAAKVLANALAENNTNLLHLDIEDNAMTENGVKGFDDIMKNSSNKYLDYTAKVSGRRLSRITSRFTANVEQ
jgi:Ran GTPase-activating protein (RanGAP) involved in mRNA processing and transport